MSCVPVFMIMWVSFVFNFKFFSASAEYDFLEIFSFLYNANSVGDLLYEAVIEPDKFKL